MKKSLLATAAVATFALMASAAQAQVTGHVGANYAFTDADGADLDTYQVEGAVGFDVGQFGGLLDAAVTVVGGDIEDETDFAFTGHLNTQLGGALVGGFVGVLANEDNNVWALGAEGQFGLTAATTLYGQVGYGFADDFATDAFGRDQDANAWAARVELRHFITDTVKLQGSVGYVNVDVDGVGEADVWNFGVEGEYQFADTPWSVLAGYDYTDAENSDAEAHTFRIGGRYTFGGQTLKARNDAGADLGSVRKLFGF